MSASSLPDRSRPRPIAAAMPGSTQYVPQNASPRVVEASSRSRPHNRLYIRGILPIAQSKRQTGTAPFAAENSAYFSALRIRHLRGVFKRKHQLGSVISYFIGYFFFCFEVTVVYWCWIVCSYSDLILVSREFPVLCCHWNKHARPTAFSITVEFFRPYK